MVCTKPIRCPQCEKYVTADGEEKIIESIPLQERVAAMAPQVITPAEKRENQDAVTAIIRAVHKADSDESYDKAVAALCDIAKKLKHHQLWIYYAVTGNKYLVDMRLIRSIVKAYGHKEGRAFFLAEAVRDQIKNMEKSA
jgi:hypothetical protein